MSLNCNEINLVLSELNLSGAFIQDIVQPGFDTIAFYTYGKEGAKTVLVCTAQNSCRINETRRKIQKNEKPLRFMEILKSRIKGSRIDECFQIGLMRIVLFRLSHGEEKFNLYIRLWSNAANVILCDENNLILDTMFRRPQKGEVTGKTFVIPEEKLSTKAKQNSVSEKNVVSEVDEAVLLETSVSNSEKNAVSVNNESSALEKSVSNSEKNSVSELDEAVLLENSVSGSEKNSSSASLEKWPIRDFSEITEEYLKNHPNAKSLSFNEKVDLWYGENAQNLSRKSLLIQAEKWYSQTKTRMEDALSRLENKRREFENAESLKHQGDLVLSSAHLWDGKSNFLECEDYESGKKVRLFMNKEKSAQENASLYYEKYKKALSGMEGVLHDIELSKMKLEKLEKQYAEILNEKNPVKIEQLLRRDTTPKQHQKKTHPGLDYTVNGWYILVGRDANENDELLRHHVRGSDLWLHVRDFPGGYVFVKNRPGKTVPLEILLDAGNLAVYYSKARNAGKTDLYYTQVKYLRRAKNGPKGLVLPTHEKNLCITPDKKRLERLEELRIDL